MLRVLVWSSQSRAVWVRVWVGVGGLVGELLDSGGGVDEASSGGAVGDDFGVVGGVAGDGDGGGEFV